VIGADAVVTALNKLGVTHVFGIVSIHNMPIFDAINRDGKLQIIDCRHEMAATHAADGYARATGKIGVVIASTGPGTTNTVTGLYEAQYASSPVLLITGQAETGFYGKAQGYVHEAEEQLPMLRTVTRRSESIRASAQIESTILSVASDITTGRPSSGAIEIPINLQYEEVQPSVANYETPPLPVIGNLDAAVALITNSRKRIIIAGGGVTYGGAAEHVTRLAEKLQAPVFTTANGRGAIPEDHPLCVGNLYASRKLHSDMADADLTIAIGTRFQVGVGGAGAQLTPPGNLLHIDIDASVIDRVHKSDVALVGDAVTVLPMIEDAMNPEPADGEFVSKVQQSGRDLKAILRKRIGPDYEGIMNKIRSAMPRDALIVRDTTVPAYNFANQLLEIYGPRTFIGPNSAAIGPGLPLSIGAAAGTGKKTVVIHGDGGFMFHATELATAAQYNLPIIVCVFNDGGYGVLRGLQSTAFEGRYGDTDLGYVDFAGFATSVGMKGVAVASLADFERAFDEAMAFDGPMLLNIDMRKLIPMQGSILPEPAVSI
jgi:acetolactate synthase-1/2/3 large subunit